MDLKYLGWGFGIVLSVIGLSYGGFRVSLHKHNQSKLDALGKNQLQFEKLVHRIHKDTPYLVYITSGYRSTEHQKSLHKQNSKNARPGSSPHEFKRAIDINLIGIKGFIRKSDSKRTWIKTGVPKIADELGFRWGGNFKTYHDPVHFDVQNPG